MFKGMGICSKTESEKYPPELVAISAPELTNCKSESVYKNDIMMPTLAPTISHVGKPFFVYE